MRTTILSLTIIALFCIPGMTQETKSHSHDDHLNKLVHEYLLVKDALSRDNYKMASAYINNFAEEVKGNTEMKHHPEHTSKHAKQHTAMLSSVDAAVSAKDLDGLRSSFNNLTAELIKVLKNQGYDTMNLFIQYCPMAENGKGAKWLSQSEEIDNPYYGTKMSTCGSTIETIK